MKVDVVLLLYLLRDAPGVLELTAVLGVWHYIEIGTQGHFFAF
jgi:hypothetical protein